jgi:hypothetical protein
MLPRDARDAAKMKAVFARMKPHRSQGAYVCFVGHSHVPAIFYEDGRFLPAEGHRGSLRARRERAEPRAGERGSVGQPRDGDSRLSYALFDGAKLWFVRLEYDIAEAQQDIRAVRELPGYLADRWAWDSDLEFRRRTSEPSLTWTSASPSLCSCRAWSCSRGTYFYASKHPPAPPRPKTTTQAPQSSGAADAATKPLETAAVDDRPALGTRRVDTEERTFTLPIGTPGKPGSYLARFTNKGAALLELRLGNSYDAPRLSDAERADVAHWTHVVDSAPQAPVTRGPLALEASVSAKDFARVSLREALWQAQVLGGEEHPTGIDSRSHPAAGWCSPSASPSRRGATRSQSSSASPRSARHTAGDGRASCSPPAEVVPQESGDRFYIEPQGMAAGRELGEVHSREKPVLDVKVRDDAGRTLTGSYKLPDGPMSFAACTTSSSRCSCAARTPPAWPRCTARCGDCCAMKPSPPPIRPRPTTRGASSRRTWCCNCRFRLAARRAPVPIRCTPGRRTRTC